MKVIWKDPEVERTDIFRLYGELRIAKNKKWFTGSKKQKKPWYKYGPPHEIKYGVCKNNRFTFFLLRKEDDPQTCWVHQQIPNGQHKAKWDPGNRWWKHSFKVPVKESAYGVQMRGLCIERVLTSWIFRKRYRKNKAAIKIQRWYKAIFPLRLFKRAKAHWESSQGYEPTKVTGAIHDPDRKPGDE